MREMREILSPYQGDKHVRLLCADHQHMKREFLDGSKSTLIACHSRRNRGQSSDPV